jgi:LuxR family maltose regulon positive regulatory protein
MGQAARAMTQLPQPPPSEVVLTALVNEMTGLPAPFLLVLDDYHVIRAMPIHEQLDFLVEHHPPEMHLIIATREDPPLPLPRLRARAQMVEIRQADLRFSLEECGDFLRQVMGLHLSLEEIGALERRTEGWIAGLQLAALSMRGCDDLSGFIRAFSGSSHYVLEYLIAEVLDRQSPEEQDFLLKTSILDQLCGPLCDAVVDRTDSSRVLSRLERANLFVSATDPSHTWYRYHNLFAELLRQRLQRGDTFAEDELHRRASRWFEGQRFLPEAVAHALAAAEWERAADLIREQAEAMLGRGELVTLLGWLRALPAEAINQRPELCREYGWALTLTGQLDAADAYLLRAETAARDEPVLLGKVLVAQAYNLRLRGQSLQAIDRAQRARALLPEDDHLSRGLVALTLAFALWNSGRTREAEQAFLEADRAAQLSHNYYARVTALAYTAAIQAVYGRLHRAAELCRQVIEIGGQSPTIAPAHIELGVLLHEWDQPEAAAEELQRGIDLSQGTGNWLVQCDGYRNLALLQMAYGAIDEAEITLQKAHQMADSHEVHPLTRLRNAACHVQLALTKTDLGAAEYWEEQATGPADASLLYPHLMLTPVRLLMARNDKRGAADRLNELFETASHAGWGSALVEVRALQALAATETADALRFLAEALERARPEGFLRTFVDKGEPMRALLERLKPQAADLRVYVQTVLAAFGAPGKPTVQCSLVEPLSERELQVLRLVSQGLSNGEIAARLVVSLGTVKTHVHSILDKLGVGSRTQAVARARELNLL